MPRPQLLRPFRVHRRAFALVAIPLVACLVPDDDPMADTGNEPPATESSGGSSGPSSTEPADTSMSSADSGDSSAGPIDTSGDPPLECDAACPDDQLCFNGACHDIGFSRTFSGETARQTIWDVAIDPDGNLVVAGNFDTVMEMDGIVLEGVGGGLEVFVAKLDPTGQTIWAHAYVNEGFAHEIARSVAVDGDGNILVVGELMETVDFGTGPLTSAGDTDVFVLSLDSAGNTRWASAHGDDRPQRAASAAALPDGAVAFTGDYFGDLDLGGDVLTTSADATNVYVAVFEPDGSHRWSVGAGDDDYQYGFAVAAGADGSVAVCGEIAGTLDLGGDPLVANVTDAFVAQYSAQGDLSWAVANTDPGADACNAIAIDSAGNVAITGRFANGLDFGGGAGLPDDNYRSFKFATVLDAGGSHVWSRSFASGNNTEMGGDTDEIAFDGAGNIIIAGVATTISDFGGGPLPSDEAPSMFIAKLTGTGDHTWSVTWPSPNLRQAIHGLAIDAHDDIVVAGEYSGDLDLGFGAMSSPTDPDAIVARFLP